jgi:hypothetical protein
LIFIIFLILTGRKVNKKAKGVKGYFGYFVIATDLMSLLLSFSVFKKVIAILFACHHSQQHPLPPVYENDGRIRRGIVRGFICI